MSESRLRAIVGLGNPGPEYERTRHNTGFWFADLLADTHRGNFRHEAKFKGDLARIRIGGDELLLLKPQTYMNKSGDAIQPLAAFYKLEPADILVAHDELDLPVGTMKLKRAGGHGGHNGLRSIHQHLGPDYLRLRIGIGHPGTKDQVLGYVLGRPNAADDKLIRDGLIDAMNAIPVWLNQTLEKAMQQLHSISPPKQP
ncbi:aminoacyl-tRNA hydrolase [Nevskia sp.]|uniref:aminoacyl-tRNA hydrolase n=1 Tax=Nevskia sp. TaxID=1929292 RepID=UPI0025F4B368|nr:aminoacyl-tRNA hydrolase [Nevskia sp.]